MNISEIMEILGKEFVTPKEVAKILGVTTVTVNRKIESEQLEGVDLNPGGKNPTWRVRSRSVKRMLGIDDQIPA